MNATRIFQTTIVLLFLFTPLLPKNMTPIAFLGFEAKGVLSSEADILSNRFEQQLVMAKKLEVITHDQVKSILAEQDFRISNGNLSDCIVEVGMILGVEKAVVGTVDKVNGTLTVEIRIVDVYKGKVDFSTRQESEGKIDDLLTTIPGLAKKISDQFLASEKPENIKSESKNEPPEIVITSPQLSRGFKRVQTGRIRVAGRVTDPDGILDVSINMDAVGLDENGYFEADVPLADGDNEITVLVVDTKLASSKKTFTVKRESPAPPLTQTLSTAEKRLALVIGNANYKHGGSLSNPVNDARAMKQVLESLGFSVLKYENCDQKTMKRAIDDFGKNLKTKEVGLFFYAGHGVQVKGLNYLIPTDANLQNESQAEYDCVRADRVLASMEDAGSATNIVIMDACRDNPFERSWRRGARGKGLAFMNAPSGSLIAYATAPGSTALDGTGTNGVYTSAILKHINTPDITIEEVFKRVRASVEEMSGGDQTPWESTSLKGSFYFRR